MQQLKFWQGPAGFGFFVCYSFSLFISDSKALFFEDADNKMAEIVEQVLLMLWWILNLLISLGQSNEKR